MNVVAVDEPLLPQCYRVTRRIREGLDTCTLELAPTQVEIPTFRPGQFNMLYAFGVGEIAVSLSGDPGDTSRLVHTVRSVGAVSTAIITLEPGATLGVRGPFGTAWPVVEAEGRDVVFVAGGLGLAPLRPAIYHVLAHRNLYRKVIVLVGMRNPSEILYSRLLEQWRALDGVTVEVTVDESDTTWHGEVGVVPSLVSRAKFDAGNAIAMVCGPEVMMRFTANALADAAVPRERIYLSMERNMKCAVGLCGRCQFGPTFVCKDGPVMRLDRIGGLLSIHGI